MKELLYFSFSDLLVRVEYSKEANSLRYASHRSLNFSERGIVEQYLLSNFALKTEYYNRYPALFIYLGIDHSLVKELNVFHLKNTLKSLIVKEKEVKEKIDELISSSMTNYYFEQIGATILALRNEINGDCRQEKLIENKCKMSELIKAYNIYAPKKVSLEDVIPEELKPYLEVEVNQN